MAPAKKNSPSEWADSADAVAAAGLLNVTLPSGAKVTLRTLTLDELAFEDALPDDLLRVALLEQTVGVAVAMYQEVQQATPESLERAQKLSADNLDLVKRLVRRAVVAPVLSDAQVDAMDPFDRTFVAEVCQRRVREDAAGRVIGVVPLDAFEPFRVEHGCPPDCGACQKAAVEVSTHGR